MKSIKTYKTKYFEFTPEWSGFNIKYHVAGYFDSIPSLQIYFIWGKLFLYFPWKHYKKVQIEKNQSEKRRDKLNKLLNPNFKENKKYIKEYYDDCQTPSYGIYFFMQQFGICLGEKTKLYDLPWCWTWVRRSALKIDGDWLHETPKNNNMYLYDTIKWKDVMLIEKYPYTYTTKDGTVQNCIATIRVQEMEWRWKWLTWLKYPRKVVREIEIDFSTGIGERVNSWKGGVYGCSYKMKKNETPYETLKRMEKTRKF